jgi:hypothetical protein
MFGEGARDVRQVGVVAEHDLLFQGIVELRRAAALANTRRNGAVFLPLPADIDSDRAGAGSNRLAVKEAAVRNWPHM